MSDPANFGYLEALNFLVLQFFIFLILSHIVLVRFRHQTFFRVFYPVVSHWQTLNSCGPWLNISRRLHTSQKLEHGLEMRRRFCSLPTHNSAVIPPPPPDVKVKPHLVVGTVNLFNRATRLTHVKEQIEYTQQVARIRSYPGRNSVQASRYHKKQPF